MRDSRQESDFSRNKNTKELKLKDNSYLDKNKSRTDNI